MAKDTPDVGHVRGIERIDPRWRMGGLVHMLTLLIERLRDGVMRFKGHNPIWERLVVPDTVNLLGMQTLFWLRYSSDRENWLNPFRVLSLPVAFETIDMMPDPPTLFMEVDVSHARWNSGDQVRKAEIILFAVELERCLRTLSILDVHLDGLFPLVKEILRARDIVDVHPLVHRL
ncbi:MAG: hypothetical protein M3Z35_12780 [Nitrospirota bacterium]|nr:hypothetical protein [Nitrospirota bacterium]